MYGSQGMQMTPIPAFGDKAPYMQLGNTTQAMHTTYNPSDRNKYYSMPAESRAKSMGCVNYPNCDINEIVDTFPKGDTAIVVDSKIPKDNLFLNQFKANGGQLPQYGLGSWLKENAGAVGTIAGAGLGLALAPVTGGASLLAAGALGSQIGGTIGGVVQKDAEQDINQAELDRQQSINTALNAYNNKQQLNPMYGANFANGGMLNSYACGGKVYGCGGKMKANGGQLGNDNGAAQMTKGLDGITVYPKSAGTHETSATNGIPIGNKGLVEGSEVRFGKYVFSNKF
jgi:hypothetical protein